MNGSRAPIGEDDLQSFVDGRLAGERLALVEGYLGSNPEARTRVTLERQQRDALRAALQAKFAEPVPARLRVAAIRAARRRSWRQRVAAVAAALVLLVVGGAGGWFARGQSAASSSGTTTVTRDAVAAYRTFVVEVAHPVEVGAAQEAHLVRWLSKRLGRPLKAPDLARFGFRLMGGRLLSADAGAAAQLMYETDGGRRLTVYVQATQGGETAFRFRQDGETATFAWLDQGYGFAVTANSDRAELLPIAEVVYQSLDGAILQP
ncbi:anti-sigma factor family protein [Chelatococcus asaccharovorans]|uniref:Anti-sigma factor RsiW n=1 Tax=Chelatococcus asaccharovorans TaxID=28210 RepID=A0A2V3TYJ4_9HYPH|nr:anti-sigma factor [Chelatococcus asaccharovorans]MBS7706839.1 anti-sigma factor [Chelatococcus asaccharovorans]PXW54015.1 anti-sigma factor RsiW [Chelatococcus asaccharovorans]